jgi:hypothetical protein
MKTLYGDEVNDVSCIYMCVLIYPLKTNFMLKEGLKNFHTTFKLNMKLMRN